MIVVLQEGTRRAKKAHQCFHCYRMIEPGARYGYQTNKYDFVYTLRWHIDCEEMAEKVRDPSDHYDDEGWGPLRDDLVYSGEYPECLEDWRGEYPHVVCRMELTDQLREVTQ